MDLKKVRKVDYHFEVILTDDALSVLENFGMIYSPASYFLDTKTFIDICYSAHSGYISIHVGNTNEEEDRTFYEFEAIVKNGKLYRKTFWGAGIVQCMHIEDFRKTERFITVNLKAGVYDGSGSAEEWTNVLTSIEDFIPVAYPATSHSLHMDNLLQMGNYSDFKMLCSDGRELNCHKCLLLSCPYFRAFLSDNFVKHCKETVKVDFEYDHMKVVLQFLYSGRINEDDVKNWPQLYEIANFYCLDTLARHCQLQMMIRASRKIDGIKSLLEFALKFNARKLIVFLINVTRQIQEDSCRID